MFNKLSYIIGGLRPVDVKTQDSDTTIIQQLKLKNRFVEPLSVENQKLKELAYKKIFEKQGFPSWCLGVEGNGSYRQNRGTREGSKHKGM